MTDLILKGGQIIDPVIGRRSASLPPK